MENKINVAEILKDCPKGMELDCVMYDGVILDEVSNKSDYPIKISTKNGFSTRLTKYGQNVNIEDAKCVIFPKGKTTWEGFQQPFNDGDIVYTIMDSIAILNNRIGEHSAGFYAYCGLFNHGFDFDVIVSPKRLATEEEKQKLFQAIKDNGYKWNAETKTLKKLETFKFALNSIVRLKGTDIHYRVVEQKMNRIMGYYVEYEYKLRNIIDNSTKMVYAVDEDDYELVPDKFDINTLVPFESRVLVRDYIYEEWKASFWGYLTNNHFGYNYDTIRGNYKQCIPYEGNEHLLGTTNDCDEYFKTWK